MRKALESDHVSENLHHWIDLVWGFQQRGEEAVRALNLYSPDLYDTVWTARTLSDPNQRATTEASLCYIGQVPPQLFSKRHPRREKVCLPSVLPPQSSHPLDIPRDITAALLSLSKGKVTLSAVVGDALVEFRLKAADQRMQSRRISSARLSGIAKLLPGGHVVLENGTIVPGPPGPTDWVVDAAFADDFWAVVGNNSALRLIGPTVNSTVQFYGDVIRCCAISRTFKMAVCGTVANHIVIVSLFDAEKVCVVDIGLKPNAVVVTEGWGFIAVRAIDEKKTEFLVLLDVNGRLIRSVQAPAPICTWAMWRSLDGFDYLLVATRHGEVFNLEAFYCEFRNPIYRTPDAVVALAYFEHLRAVLIVTAKRKVVTISGDSIR
jgi:hypothetical protein